MAPLEEVWRNLRAIWGDRQLALVYLNIALYALCYQMQRPMLPELVHSLGEQGSAAFARVESIAGTVQLVGGLLSGPLMDKLGPRFLFLVSFIASLASYWLTISATTVTGLYLSRLPTVVQHAMMAGRTIVTIRSTPECRAALLAYLMSAYGIGMTIGPALGGHITTMSGGDPKVVSAVACAGTAVSCVLVLFFVPDVSPPASAPAAAAFSLPSLARALRARAVVGALLIKTGVAFAGALIHSFLPIFMTEHLGLSVEQKGFILSFFGVILFINAPVIGAVKQYAGDATICRITSLAAAACFLVVPMQSDARGLYAVAAVLAPVSALFNNVSTALLTATVPPQFAGSIIALDMAIGSGVRIISPLAVVWLIGASGVLAVGRAAALLTLACSAALWLWRSFGNAPKLGPMARCPSVSKAE
eukprot:TRINITY_DN13173_c0_g1_i1.p1 TRINITY_DN13173_c0_g1~~TRINITY_DN13173_c0_g1_i1.p1  ORF type:complete len:419 (+),score=138.10 TRINITY_DN13173_c0_g1_i1:77-1333(+)